MPSYTLTLLGLEISFRTDADEKRVSDAESLVEDLYRQLSESGKSISKEKLLRVLVLSLADDCLQLKEKLSQMEDKLASLLVKIE